MRLPGSKIYRAFPELDRFTDEQCAGWVAGAWLTHRVALIGMYVVAAVVGAVVAGACLTLTVYGLRSGTPTNGFAETAALVFLIAFPCVGFAAAFYFVRDLSLRRAIRNRLSSTRCGRCNYQLLGLPIKGTKITCAECGFVLDFREVGLKAEDFMGEIRSE